MGNWKAPGGAFCVLLVAGAMACQGTRTPGTTTATRVSSTRIDVSTDQSTGPPVAPDIGQAITLSSEQLGEMTATIKGHWPGD